MKISALLAPLTLAVVAAVSVGCSSSSPATTPEDQDRGIEGEGAAAAAPDKNPDGVAYPTKNFGTSARSGDRSGNVISNYKFMAYVDGDVSKGLAPVSMATYFDPSGSRYKLIHIAASGSWCPPCREEAKVVAPLRAKMEERKVVWIISLAEGPTPGIPSTQKDLDLWISQFKAPYTHFLDSGNRNLGPFYDAAALPWNTNIDARTMEILTSTVGVTPTEAAILRDLDEALATAAKLAATK